MTDVTQQVTGIIAGIRGHKPEKCKPDTCQCMAAAEEIVQLLQHKHAERVDELTEKLFDAREAIRSYKQFFGEEAL
jgi:hypothetical protein